MLVAAHGIATICVGAALLYIRATMTNAVFDLFDCMVALILVAASLLFSALLDWAFVGDIGLHRFRELRSYLLLSLICAGGGLFFALYPKASIQMLCYFVAAYALLLGIGKFRLAQSWKSARLEKILIYLLGAIAVSFSGVLVSVSAEDETVGITVLGIYCIFVGAQMLLSIAYLYRHGSTHRSNISEQKHLHA